MAIPPAIAARAVLNQAEKVRSAANKVRSCANINLEISWSFILTLLIIGYSKTKHTQIRIRVMKHSSYLWLALNLFSSASISAISLVYNFRIAEITREPIFEPAPAADNNIVGLIFDQYQKKYSGNISQNFVGGLASYIKDFGPYYFRADGAFSHIKENTNHLTTFSGTETDDLLFTLGRNVYHSDQTTLTVAGLMGIPTHKIYRLQHVDFGYSQGSMGIQFDGSYEWLHDRALLFGARYFYFIPRHALDKECDAHIFTIGNLTDLLLAYKHNWNKHGLELGSTFRTEFAAKSEPSIDDIVKKTDYLRTNVYVVYKYKFIIHDIANRFLINFSIGRDHRSKEFGNKYIVTLWGSWKVRF